LPEPALPPLRELIQRYEIGARKGLGQHFLLDLNLTRRIAREAGSLEDCAVIEIGAGPGGLTRALLAEGARHVTAIERDPRCVAALAELAAAYPGRLDIVEGDALAIDAATLTPAPRQIVANLPYNIGTALLLKWLHGIAAYRSLTLMFQKEVAERLLAAPRSAEYGRLSVVTQFLTRPRRLFDIAPQAFVPPPKVVSTVVRLEPRAEPAGGCSLAALERVTAAAFGQRRKMLRASLRALGVDTEALIAAAAVAPTARAEELDLDAFCRLASTFESLSRPRAGG
jgi:16S rRNA (adenine1518-N6/adenine1519-N6)-dimethyltransferase